MIDRSQILIRRAILDEEDSGFVHTYDFERTALERFSGYEFVVLRGKDRIYSVFAVTGEFDVEKLEHALWPNTFLAEAMATQKKKKGKPQVGNAQESALEAVAM